MKKIFYTGAGIIVVIVLTTIITLGLSGNEGRGGYAYQPTRVAATISTNISVATDTQLLASSTSRIYARIVNNCGAAVYLNTEGRAAGITNGFVLAASGGEWDSLTDNSVLYTGAIHASSTNQTSCSLNVIEF